ncbi:sigma 54 modulation/S30EA ribosomal C-terminal domain-containing protein [Amycolatopsis mongoliensis]|uniref:Sigma 54 modulation/S30EA ribosomal C-terminal domain-containing protein n=1 Tax=Amycolatopsis mongoliensis TaxID=715475 RepID=A0A9Y2JNV6_9PSEU|nr:sigma 54 modulation/S30EA ribosomal C-terminal domain-containing protein [Amycolatopsis sp. 4-36]WIY00774.1 sigma 54 modulation/S30EA ribosomal C-terminal domain-containing protein [Amycolatopsis sp. 4-36]
MTPPRTSSAVTVEVSTDGRELSHAPDYARRKIGALLHLAHGPVLSAHVRLTRHPDPAVPYPVTAHADIDVDGRLVHAHADGENSTEAIDRLEDRLAHRLERAAEHWEARRGRMPATEPHEWRHQSEPARHDSWYPRPEADRETIPHFSYTPHPCTVDEAAVDLGRLGHEFQLFTEAGTGRDAVLYRAGATGFRLALLTPPAAGELARFRLPLTISAQPAPLLSTAEAIVRLNDLGLPFLFHTDAEHGRGAVLYHRYDGHYGLIVPAE